MSRRHTTWNLKRDLLRKISCSMRSVFHCCDHRDDSLAIPRDLKWTHKVEVVLESSSSLKLAETGRWNYWRNNHLGKHGTHDQNTCPPCLLFWLECSNCRAGNEHPQYCRRRNCVGADRWREEKLGLLRPTGLAPFSAPVTVKKFSLLFATVIYLII